jgi:hypothetical protein
MTKPAEISAQPVVRDRWGGWTHPDFFSPSDSREFPRPGEFEAWLAEHHLQSATVWMENDVPDWMMDTFWKTGNCSLWQPSVPAGGAGLPAVFTIRMTEPSVSGCAAGRRPPHEAFLPDHLPAPFRHAGTTGNGGGE